MIIAQLSDPHIVARGKLFRGPIQGVASNAERVRREFDTATYLSRAVAGLNELVPQPDITVVTGDLVDNGTPEEYDHFRALLAPLAMPVFVIPGNHDAREPLRVAFRSDGYLPADGTLDYVIDDYALRLVALDTLVDGNPHGTLNAEQLVWLDATLAEQPDWPTVVMMHHPPFATGITYMDGYSLDSAVAFAAVVARHPQIECAPTTTTERSIRDSLVAEASYALWLLIMQREACGLNDSTDAMQIYGVPNEIFARMGPSAMPSIHPTEGLNPKILQTFPPLLWSDSCPLYGLCAEQM
jgi:3',5'-cyclic-AMP phosphodiesterase